MLRVIGAVFWPPDWLPSAYDDCGAGAGAGAGAAAVREAFWALAFAASSSVPCVAQPAAVRTAAAAVASARARRVFMVSPCLGKNTLSLKLYLRKCFRVPGGYHWRREKCRPAAPHARGSGAVPHHRQVDQAALPGRRAPFAPEGRPAVGARPGGRKPRRHRGRPGARARHPPVDRQQPAARARARRAGHARAGEHGPAPGAAVRDEEGLEALEGGAAPADRRAAAGALGAAAGAPARPARRARARHRADEVEGDSGGARAAAIGDVRLVRREAVKQSSAAGGLQLVLAAATRA